MTIIPCFSIQYFVVPQSPHTVPVSVFLSLQQIKKLNFQRKHALVYRIEAFAIGNVINVYIFVLLKTSFCYGMLAAYGTGMLTFIIYRKKLSFNANKRLLIILKLLQTKKIVNIDNLIFFNIIFCCTIVTAYGPVSICGKK